MWKRVPNPWDCREILSRCPCGKERGLSTGNGETRVIHIFNMFFHGKRRESVETVEPYFFELMLVVMSRTVSAKTASFFMRCSTCSMECITVVWSRSPNSRPMSL